MSLSEEAITLQRAAHELMYLGMDGSPVYSDDLSRRNGEVYRLTMALYRSGVKGTTIDEQANVCLALLMGYTLHIGRTGMDKKQIMNDRNQSTDFFPFFYTYLVLHRNETAQIFFLEQMHGIRFSAVGGTHSIPDFDLFLYSHFYAFVQTRVFSWGFEPLAYT